LRYKQTGDIKLNHIRLYSNTNIYFLLVLNLLLHVIVGTFTFFLMQAGGH